MRPGGSGRSPLPLVLKFVVIHVGYTSVSSKGRTAPRDSNDADSPFDTLRCQLARFHADTSFGSVGSAARSPLYCSQKAAGQLGVGSGDRACGGPVPGRPRGGWKEARRPVSRALLVAI